MNLWRLKILTILILGLLALNACAPKPTKVFSSQDIILKKDRISVLEMQQITENTVIVDARPAFEYELSHINGSVNLRWEDFCQKEPLYRGLLDTDTYFQSRRLAAVGIDPETPVIVVGSGINGKAEEGRVAWTLKYLGIKNVQFISIEKFSRVYSLEEAPPRPSRAAWKPVLNSKLLAELPEFKNAVGKKKIIDVRKAADYLGKNLVKNAEKGAGHFELGAINVPWTDFLNTDGSVKKQIVSSLNAVGIQGDDEIYVISESGVESALVTIIMQDLGFPKTKNFAGGYLQLSAGK